MFSSLEEIKTKLHKYLFPVEERKVYFQDADGNPLYSKEYKSIVRADSNALISIMNNTYKMKSNYDVIMPVMENLHNLDTKWVLDASHSFVKSNRMRLQVTFPDLKFNDGTSDIALSLFLHNSYDGSEGVRMFWGAIRGICSNGMVFGKVLARFYARHTKTIHDKVNDMQTQISNTYEAIPVIKERIEILKNLNTVEITEKKIKDEFGVKAFDYVKANGKLNNQWALYNALTYYISHVVKQHMRASYQLRVSRMFEL